ncbi:MAG: Adenosine deaminase [Frankiales bacterium]|nr:Adenosine deaminase [Frankiales bacterium]
MRLPTGDPADLYQFTSLNHFLEIYGVICNVLTTVEAYRRVTYEVLQDAAAAGVRYREMFFSPGFPLQLGVPIETVWEGITQGLANGVADFDVACRIILDVDKPQGARHAEEMIAFASKQDRNVLIGVGGDSVERDVDHRQFAPAFRAAKDAGLHRTMHAGEDGPADNIRISLDDLGCERIDHGFRLLDDAALTARIAAERIPVTTCPTSNVVIANVIPDVSAHPFQRMRDAGVLATLNSDDPGMMRFDLADEYAAVSQAFGYDVDNMEAIALDGIESCWAPDDEKAALRKRFGDEFKALRGEYSA